MTSIRHSSPFQAAAWTFLPLALLASAVFVPYCFMHGPMLVAFTLQRGFSLTCHQHPDRCFWLFGAPVAVCARCLGIYLGASVGLLLYTSRQIALRLFIGAAALNALDAATELAGVHGNWLDVRFVLGLLLGAAGALLISSSCTQSQTQPVN